MAALFVRVTVAPLLAPLLVARVCKAVLRPPPLPSKPPVKVELTLTVPAPVPLLAVTPVLYPSVPAASVVLPAVEAMVYPAADDVRPVGEASLAHTFQPFLALVLTVAKRGVGLALTEPVAKVPRLSPLPLREKLNVWGTEALTAI